jgi:hypothetical protein
MANFLMIISCASNPPVWVESRPKDQSYWHGVGFASSDGSKNPSELAKEYAIHEISSQIKVNLYISTLD